MSVQFTPMHHSKNIRLAADSYFGQQHYFVTICCFKRRKIFDDRNHCSRLLELFRSECAARNFAVHAYCLMPDHFHFLAEGLQLSSDLLNLTKAFKLKTSRTYVRQEGQILWQRKFYDHILRSNESPDSVAWYIWLNPVRKGLSATAHTYPFNGSFTSRIPRLNPPSTIRVPPWRQPVSMERPLSEAGSCALDTGEEPA
jgi:putative transposase